MNNPILIQSDINANIQDVWNKYTQAEHVTKWNYASDDWFCPKAEVELTEGGKFTYTMAAKDESMSFDFWGLYKKIDALHLLQIELGDGRKMEVHFNAKENQSLVEIKFEAENVHERELQKAGWQSILNNFKKYCESK